MSLWKFDKNLVEYIHSSSISKWQKHLFLHRKKTITLIKPEEVPSKELYLKIDPLKISINFQEKICGGSLFLVSGQSCN